MRQRKQVAVILAQKHSFFHIYQHKSRKSADTHTAGFQRGRIDYALRLFGEKLK